MKKYQRITLAQAKRLKDAGYPQQRDLELEGKELMAFPQEGGLIHELDGYFYSLTDAGSLGWIAVAVHPDFVEDLKTKADTAAEALILLYCEVQELKKKSP